MALSKHTLTLILIFAFLLLLTQCSKATSDDEGTPSPAPVPAEEEEEGGSSPSPAPKEDEEEEDDEDEDEDEKGSAPSSTPKSIVTTGPAADSPLSASELAAAADSPLSMSELFELSLPEIGVQKAVNTPLTEGAKVSTKQLEGIEHKIVEFKTTLTKREASDESDASKKCISQCQGNLDDATDGVKKGIESINKQDLSKANVDISGVATDIETCSDCFIEADEEDKDVNAFNVWIKGVTKEILSNLKQT
ncbi:hypothetical protein L1987_28263 [Smallanthus sonchifolius]|uniref:Uncharacterized protein n=1 Tax=Smallanthus sonchifolius TaxID=185202 RepID=A0ACB9ICF6_9ASTR|nr:hypothetical protein L1987_28263 [Smallanthus sonchifolius]